MIFSMAGILSILLACWLCLPSYLGVRGRPAKVGSDRSMLALRQGRYTARLAETPADLMAAQTLRYQCFMEARGIAGTAQDHDTDRFDAACLHMLVEQTGSGALACTYRLMPLESGTGLHLSYAAQFYDLEGLSSFPAPMMELGRFCVAPGHAPDADLLRVAWGAIARIVDAKAVQMLFGCASFDGADPVKHHAALQSLAAHHLGPKAMQPRKRHSETVAYAEKVTAFDPRLAQAQTPALLRTYLMMGGWVSDHAVLDRQLDTLHVFTALDIAAIPPARARALRAVAV
jgi:L-ornithine Nalpha-acyltransferase